MKKSMLVAGLFQFVVALVLAAPAVAQQSEYSIEVPFPFHVGARVLPAGAYSIEIVAAGAVKIQGVDQIATSAAFRRNRPAYGPQNAELVFHRYGQQYFLFQTWFLGEDQGYEFSASHAEREYARKMLSAETVLRAAK